jgi:biotin carboxyl carrier protein
MKMENELRAPRAGTVREVRCAEGAAVEAGQDLVVVDAAP